MLRTRDDAYDLLRSLGASDRLLRHVELVGETADHLIGAFRDLGLECDSRFIQLGAAIHDAGKVLFTEELNDPGTMHEAAGQDLMLNNGVQPDIARCCVSHADWQASECSFEELVVALSDKLWRGKREQQLELLVIDASAAKLGQTRWDVFMQLDAVFEQVAAGASGRLSRS